MKAIAFKRNLVMALTILLVGAFALPSNGWADLEDGLLAHWTFDEGSGTTLYDVFGDHDGTIHGSPAWEQGVGGSGYCLRFDGVNDYAEINDVSDFVFINQSLTYSAWVQIVDNPDVYRFFISLADAYDERPDINLAKDRSGAAQGRIYMQVYGSGESFVTSIDDGNTLPKNQWLHVVGVVDQENSKLSLYINAEFQDDDPLVAFDMSQAADLRLWIGASSWVTHGYHKGLIDEVRIYDGALSEEEIEELYEMHAPPPTLVLKDGSDSHNPIPNKSFQIYKVTNNPPDMTETYLGELTTDGNGKITLPEGWFDTGDSVKVERLLHTEPAVRHTGIMPNMYYVTLDNAKFDTETGAISYHTLTGEAEQEVILDHTTITFDLLVSVEWDADQDYLDSLWFGFKNLSNYLYDVSDGQIYLNKVLIYDSKENWRECDVKVYASNWERPHVRDAWNMRDPWYWFWNSYIHVPRTWWGKQDDTRNSTCWREDWYSHLTHSLDFRSKGHEIGHYALGFYDEYVFTNGRRCGNINYGFMDSTHTQPYGSELSNESHYVDEACQNTQQYDRYGVSCWSCLEDSFEQSHYGLFCPIIKPSERNLEPGKYYFAGPNDGWYYDNCNYKVGRLLLGGINNNDAGCITVLATCYDLFGNPLPKADIRLRRSFSLNIYQGKTADADFSGNYEGQIRVLGYLSGDQLYTTFGRVEIEDKGESVWLYGEGTLDASGVSKYGNLYEISPAGDSIEIFLKAVEGNYPLIHLISLSSGTPEYILYTSQPFSENPTLELYPEDNPPQTYTFQPTPTGYFVSVPDYMGNSGMFTLLALDDSSNTFFVNTNYNFIDSLDTLPISEIAGPGGGCNLYLDPLNSGLEKVAVLSSPYPPLRTGLDPLSEQVGEIYSLSWYPTGTLLGSNSLTIHYADSDLESQSEAMLAIFKWNENLLEWKQLCGGFIDTGRNFVGTTIDTLGVYAAFTTGYLRGDANGDGQINLADVVYLVNWLFIGGPPPEPMEAGDANCDGEVNLADAVYIINYLFIGGPPPVC